jgi:hypothetical protein
MIPQMTELESLRLALVEAKRERDQARAEAEAIIKSYIYHSDYVDGTLGIHRHNYRAILPWVDHSMSCNKDCDSEAEARAAIRRAAGVGHNTDDNS